MKVKNVIYIGGVVSITLIAYVLYSIKTKDLRNVSLTQVAASDQVLNSRSLDLEDMEHIKQLETGKVQTPKKSPASVTKAPLVTNDQVATELQQRLESDGFIVVVKKEQNLTREDLQEIFGSAVNVESEIIEKEIFLVKDMAGNSPETFMEGLMNQDVVLFVEENTIADTDYIPRDLKRTTQLYFHLDQEHYDAIGNWNPGIVPGADMDAAEAWDIERQNGEEIVVAVIDTGVDYNQTDLKVNMWDGSGGCKDENNQIIPGGCPFHGWDFLRNDNDPYDSREHRPEIDRTGGHGTRVAGTFAAESGNNFFASGIDTAGISRYNKVKVMALRTNYSIEQAIRAINFAKNNGAHIVNGSFSGSRRSIIFERAISDYGNLYITTAGNLGTDNDQSPRYPCNMELANIICVGGMNAGTNDQYASLSNYGVNSVDIAASFGVIGPISSEDERRSPFSSGTSYSAPLVAGTAAMALSTNPDLTTDQVRDIVLSNVDVLPVLRDKVATGGRVNLEKVIRAALTTRDDDPAEPPLTNRCVDEGNGDNWGVNLDTFAGCWIGGVPDPRLCLDDGDGDNQGRNPGTGIECDLDIEPEPDPLILAGYPVITIDGENVQINFTLNQPARAWFEYGLTTKYTNQSEIPESYDYASHQHTLTLQPNTTYNMRIQAVTNSGESYESTNYQFTTGDEQEPPKEPTCIDEGNGDNWGFDPTTNAGCWIDGIPDTDLCLDDGDGDNQGRNPGTGIECDLDIEPEPDPPTDPGSVTIKARGTNGQEKIGLFLNEKPIFSWNLSKRFEEYTFIPKERIVIDSLSVEFLNDYWDPRNSINYDAQIDHITVNGVQYESEDASTNSTGTWDQENWCAPGSKSSEWLHCSGRFEYDIPTGTIIGP